MVNLSNVLKPTPRFGRHYQEILESALRALFSRETCYPDERGKWSAENPALGQCAVTALVVQDYMGGEIMYDKVSVHFWNRVDGVELDFTREQFPDSAVILEMGCKFEGKWAKHKFVQIVDKP